VAAPAPPPPLPSLQRATSVGVHLTGARAPAGRFAVSAGVRRRASLHADWPLMFARPRCLRIPATLARLAIKGIRSFGPEHSGVITFPKPLTLIVGRNGSGKTVRSRRRGASGACDQAPGRTRACRAFAHVR
jgi:hypothetical protein